VFSNLLIVPVFGIHSLSAAFCLLLSAFFFSQFTHYLLRYLWPFPSLVQCLRSTVLLSESHKMTKNENTELPVWVGPS
jgi:hypothetical protein